MSAAGSAPPSTEWPADVQEILAPFIAAYRAAPMGPATVGAYLDALGPAGEAHARRSVLLQIVADASRGGRTPEDVVAPLVGDLAAVLADLGRAMGYTPARDGGT